MCRTTQPGGLPSTWPTTPKPEHQTLSSVPTDALSQSAYQHAVQNLHPAILNHSIRVYLLAHALASRSSSPWINADRLPLLFAACVLHDIGTCGLHNGSQRFEVEGADAAASIVTYHGFNEADAHDVWVAIAVHASPGIAERISPLACLVRVAVLRDFKATIPASAGQWAVDLGDEMKTVMREGEERFPRLGIEKVLGDAVVEQALQVGTSEKAPAGSWPGNLMRAHKENPDWEGANKAF